MFEIIEKEDIGGEDELLIPLELLIEELKDSISEIDSVEVHDGEYVGFDLDE